MSKHQLCLCSKNVWLGGLLHIVLWLRALLGCSCNSCHSGGPWAWPRRPGVAHLFLYLVLHKRVEGCCRSILCHCMGILL
jgi:hypothetical protein